MHMYIYVYVHICICTYMYMYIFIHTYMYMCTYLFIHIYIYKYVYVYMNITICTSMYMYVYVYMYMHISPCLWPKSMNINLFCWSPTRQEMVEGLTLLVRRVPAAQVRHWTSWGPEDVWRSHNKDPMMVAKLPNLLIWFGEMMWNGVVFLSSIQTVQPFACFFVCVCQNMHIDQRRSEKGGVHVFQRGAPVLLSYLCSVLPLNFCLIMGRTF